MKQFIKFRFNEEYFPTPRCRKTRVREVDSSISVNIRECHKEDAPIVMIVKDGTLVNIIRAYKGKLYKSIKHFREGLLKRETLETFNFQARIYGPTDYNINKNGEIGNEQHAAKIKKNARKLLIIDDIVFEKISEPIYQIYNFGCNDGAGMFIEYKDRVSSKKDCYSALEREECHEELKRILSYSRNKLDTSDSYNIKVLAPEYVKFKHKVANVK